ncbi:MAG: hypothetical protein AAF957_15105 [Planctomycetota bacterium]
MKSFLPPCSLMFLAACGAVRLEEGDWRARAHALSRVGETPTFSARGENLVSPPLFAGSRLAYDLEHRRNGATNRWRVRLTGPSGPDDIDQSYTVTATADRDGPDAGAQRKVGCALYRGTLTVEEDDGSAESTDALLALGFFRNGLLVDPEGDGGSVLDEPQILRGASLVAMSMLASKNTLIRGLLRDVVQRPSLLKMVLLRFDVVASADWTDTETVETGWGRGVRFPIEITINGDPALVGAVTGLPARGALELSAGIVEFVGFAPDRPDDVLRLTLRSALGPPGLGEDGVPPKIIRAEHWIESR